METRAKVGHSIYSVTLAGDSDDIPVRIALDTLGNAVVIGTTYSRDFPVTADAFQRVFAGPAAAPSWGFLYPGGDLFISVISSSGQIVYSTYAGSPSNETEAEVFAVGDEFHITVRSGPGFSTLPSTERLPFVFLTFDSGQRKITGKHYLPTEEIDGYAGKRLLPSGATVVAGLSWLLGFDRWGGKQWAKSLAKYEFRETPAVSAAPRGDVWLTGRTVDTATVIGVADGGAEVFHWRLPLEPVSSDTYVGFAPPLFSRDGLAYLPSYSSRRRLEFTTSNAMLHTPCGSDSGAVATLSGAGELRMLSYLPGYPSLALSSGNVEMRQMRAGQIRLIPFDLSSRPKATCIADENAPYGSGAHDFGIGQMLTLRGGGFGPENAVDARPEGGRLPKSVAGVKVLVAGTEAPLLSVARGVAVFAIPFDTPAGEAPVAVEFNGERSEEFPIRVHEISPTVYSVRNEDGQPNSYRRPAPAGSVVTISVAGVGRFEPPLADGAIVPKDPPRIAAPVQLILRGNGEEPEAEIVFAGAVPGRVAGAAEIRFRVPRNWKSGSASPMLTIGGSSVSTPAVWMRQ